MMVADMRTRASYCLDETQIKKVSVWRCHSNITKKVREVGIPAPTLREWSALSEKKDWEVCAHLPRSFPFPEITVVGAPKLGGKNRAWATQVY